MDGDFSSRFDYFVGVEAVSASSTIFFRKGEIKLGIEVRYAQF